MRWDAIMRGTWVLAVVVGRMALKAWGLGAEGRIALGMFWKSGGRANNVTTKTLTLFMPFKIGCKVVEDPGFIYMHSNV